MTTETAVKNESLLNLSQTQTKSQPSGRAKAFLEASIGESSLKTNAVQEAFQQRQKQRIECSSVRICQSSSPKGKSKKALFACSVCKEKLLKPCAASCGHICCEKCWLQWLKVKSTCPICREPVDKNKIKVVETS
jgi:hypothetical protein